MLLGFLNKQNIEKTALGLAFAVTLFGVGASDGDQKIGEVQLMALTNLHEIDKNNKRDIVTSRDNDDNAAITYEIVIKQNPIPGVEWVKYDREPEFTCDLEMIPKDLAKKEDFKRTFKVKKGNWGKIYPVEATINWRKRTQNPGEDPKKVEWLDGKKATASNVAYLDDKSDTRYAVTPDVSLTSLAFNHKAGCADDGFDIRKNATAGTRIVAPEFKVGKNDPAAYKAEIKPTIIGTFDLKPVCLNQLTVKGNDKVITNDEAGETGGAEGSGEAEPQSPLGTITGGAQNRTGADMRLSLEAVDTIEKKVTKATQTWGWEVLIIQGVTMSGDYWKNITDTSHTIYVTLNEPKAPWVQAFGAENTQVPWTDALDFAIVKKDTLDVTKHGAQNETTEKGALSELTKMLCYLDGYNYPDNSSSYFIDNATPSFMLSNFIAKKNKITDEGATATPNCADSAFALSVTSKILGIDNNVKRLEFQPGGRFSCHFFILDAEGKVFDACRGVTIAVNSVFEDFIRIYNPAVVLNEDGESPFITNLYLSGIK